MVNEEYRQGFHGKFVNVSLSLTLFLSILINISPNTGQSTV